MTPTLKSLLVIATLSGGLAAGPALGQAVVPFGGIAHDASLPVEIAADSLTVNQAESRIVFAGNVRVGQGTLRLSANQITVLYSGAGATGEVTRMEAAGGVLLTNGAEAAEAERASYNVETGIVEMAGEVLLTQGENALSGDALAIDLNAGTAQMQGRVRTILQPQANQ